MINGKTKINEYKISATLWKVAYREKIFFGGKRQIRVKMNEILEKNTKNLKIKVWKMEKTSEKD